MDVSFMQSSLYSISFFDFSQQPQVQNVSTRLLDGAKNSQPPTLNFMQPAL